MNLMIFFWKGVSPEILEAQFGERECVWKFCGPKLVNERVSRLWNLPNCRMGEFPDSGICQIAEWESFPTLGSAKLAKGSVSRNSAASNWRMRGFPEILNVIFKLFRSIFGQKSIAPKISCPSLSPFCTKYRFISDILPNAHQKK
jgi:hypothetical protein